MASIYPNKQGQFTVQFIDSHGIRQSIYLGKVPKRFANEFKLRVERLLDGIQYQQLLDRGTLDWLIELAPKYRAKLADKGLHEPMTVSTVNQLCEYCIKEANVEPSTIQKYRDAQANLVEFFGSERPIQSVTEGDAREFRTWLKREGNRLHAGKPGPLAETTVTVRCKQVRSFFGAACEKRWLLDNPFRVLKGGTHENPDRMHFVDRETIDRILEEIPDPQFQLIVALARYAGVRIREVFSLRWDWVNWDAELGSLTVMDSKRKRYPDKRYRTPPLFPEVRKYLEKVYEAAPDGAEYVIQGPLREVTTTALTNRLERHCKHLGIILWQKPWQNMRSTRETELMDDFPLHVVCNWIGNSPRIAIRHYGQVTKEHHRRATVGRAMKMQGVEPTAPKTLHIS